MECIRLVIVLVMLHGSIAVINQPKFHRILQNPGVAFYKVKNIWLTREYWTFVTTVDMESILNIKHLCADERDRLTKVIVQNSIRDCKIDHSLSIIQLQVKEII